MTAFSANGFDCPYNNGEPITPQGQAQEHTQDFSVAKEELGKTATSNFGTADELASSEASSVPEATDSDTKELI